MADMSLTGFKDASTGPICGDCVGNLLKKTYQPNGYKCSMCGRIWWHGADLPLTDEEKSVLREVDQYNNPIIRRREAVLAARLKHSQVSR